MKLAFPILSVAVAAVPVMAQSNIDPVHKQAWGENIGWLNWRDAGSPAGSQGVRVHHGFLSGFIWAENVGWINLGDGTPVDGAEYANADGADFGVNLDAATGELYGLAWGENIGWVNFEGGAIAGPAIPAHFDEMDCRFGGYVWGENIGWINLDGTDHYVAMAADACAAFGGCGDFDGDGDVDIADFGVFTQCFGGSANPPAATCPPGVDADCDGDGDVDPLDFVIFGQNFTGSQ